MMWSTALGINTVIWTILGTYLVYSAGAMILLGQWHPFVLTAILFTLCNLATVVMGTQA